MMAWKCRQVSRRSASATGWRKVMVRFCNSPGRPRRVCRLSLAAALLPLLSRPSERGVVGLAESCVGRCFRRWVRRRTQFLTPRVRHAAAAFGPLRGWPLSGWVLSLSSSSSSSSILSTKLNGARSDWACSSDARTASWSRWDFRALRVCLAEGWRMAVAERNLRIIVVRKFSQLGERNMDI